MQEVEYTCGVWGLVVHVVSAELLGRRLRGRSRRSAAIDDLHTVGRCKKAVFACLATDVKLDTFTFTSFAL